MPDFDPANRLTATGRHVPPSLDEATVALVVRRFYARARADDLIGPIFNRVIPEENWPHHIAVITEFWSSMLLGTRSYAGRPMPKHLAIPDLEDAHFARWLMLFRATVEEICAPAIAALFVERAERIGFNFRLRIAQFRGEDIDAVRPMRAEPMPWTPPEAT